MLNDGQPSPLRKSHHSERYLDSIRSGLFNVNLVEGRRTNQVVGLAEEP